MSTEKIEAAKCALAEWDAAYNAARSGSSYSVDGISVARQDIETVIQPNRRRLQRAILQLEAAALGATAPGVRVAKMVDPWA